MNLLVLIENYIDLSLKRDNLNVFIDTQTKQNKADSEEVKKAITERD